MLGSLPYGMFNNLRRNSMLSVYLNQWTFVDPPLAEPEDQVPSLQRLALAVALDCWCVFSILWFDF